MKEKKLEKKILIGFIAIGIVALAVGISYAWWSSIAHQQSINTLITDCLKLSIEDVDNSAILLEKAYPITDNDATSLIPYTFKISNICNTTAKYDVQLEIMDLGENQLNSQYLSMNFNGEGKKRLNEYQSAEPTYDKEDYRANEAKHLTSGILKPNENASYYLTIWMDESVTTTEAMNKEFIAKIGITGVLSNEIASSTKNMMIPMKMDNNGEECVEVCDGPDNCYVECSENEVEAKYNYNLTYDSNGQYNISKVVYQDQMNPYNDAVEVKDFSVDQDRSVLGYYVLDDASTDSYSLYIQADGKIKVNPVASYYGVIKTINENMMDEDSYYYSVCTVLGLNNLDTSQVTDMSSMFDGCRGLTTLDLSSFNTSQVTNMSSMFNDCVGLTSLNVSSFDTSQVTDMSRMFENCMGLTSLDLSNFDTSRVTNMISLFAGCSGLTSLDLSNFNTSQVTNMAYMFFGCRGLTSLDVSNFNTSNVTNMGGMFGHCRGLTSLDLSNFDISQVLWMDSMFDECEKLTNLNITSFDWTDKTFDDFENFIGYLFREMPDNAIVHVKNEQMQKSILDIITTTEYWVPQWTSANVVVG